MLRKTTFYKLYYVLKSRVESTRLEIKEEWRLVVPVGKVNGGGVEVESTYKWTSSIVIRHTIREENNESAAERKEGTKKSERREKRVKRNFLREKN